jgi:predicted ATPase
MYVREIRLANVRQFENRTFFFKPGFNLLVGENGAGKTTLLRALVAVLGSPEQATRRPILIDEDIRLGARQLQINAAVWDGSAAADAHYQYDKDWGQRARRHPREHRPLLLVYGSNEATCSNFVAQRIRSYSREPIARDASDEVWLHEAEAREATPAQDGAKRFGRSQSIRTFVIHVLRRFSPKFRSFTWVFEPYGCSIRPKEKHVTVPYEEFGWRLELTRAIMRHLQERRTPLRTADQSVVVLNSNGYEVEGKKSSARVTPDFRYLLSRSKGKTDIRANLDSFVAEIRMTPRILISGDQNFLLRQLSDGEKRLFSLFVDIARQLSLQCDSTRFADVPAIIAIDEIDVHLHPKWQRLIVPALEDLFPACQFIAATHSPFVVQGVPEEKVQHLNHPLPGDFTDRGIEEITAKVMGIEDHQVGPRYLEMLDTAKRYFQLLE